MHAWLADCVTIVKGGIGDGTRTDSERPCSLLSRFST